ncbi:MAG: hypothetical protein ACD_23C00176G0003, partial [uncultured bacterium]
MLRGPICAGAPLFAPDSTASPGNGIGLVSPQLCNTLQLNSPIHMITAPTRPRAIRNSCRDGITSLLLLITLSACGGGSESAELGVGTAQASESALELEPLRQRPPTRPSTQSVATPGIVETPGIVPTPTPT